ncbi:hypothetical protein [Flavihumibacter sp. ZG627]|uniref:hypothetical protein n=1 Tax=Flavihumibacter sp. ZG627 TaxID=1463156 RepID=UPI00057D1459|nr:hypothetical protein [Flavihumibacter sp. ZG627]KIC92212.1 hypothetical protein HY58_01250 [Flavihumibacter sp. ZG627]
MKTNILIVASLVFNTALFAQSNSGTNQHGSTVSNTAKSRTGTATNGESINDRASARAKGSLATETDINSEAVSNAQAKTGKAARKAKAATKKQVKDKRDKTKDLVQSVEANTSSNNDINTSVNNEHGLTVSSVAKTEMEAGKKGAEVNEIASEKAEGNVNSASAVKSVKKTTAMTRKQSKAAAGRVKMPKTNIKTRAGAGVGIGVH